MDFEAMLELDSLYQSLAVLLKDCPDALAQLQQLRGKLNAFWQCTTAETLCCVAMQSCAKPDRRMSFKMDPSDKENRAF